MTDITLCKTDVKQLRVILLYRDLMLLCSHHGCNKSLKSIGS